MGNACCSIVPADNRPRLKVTIGTAQGLPRLDDGNEEIEAYVKLRYGPLNNSRNDTVVKSVIIKTQGMKATWDQILYLPVPSLKAHYSLEVSVWDKDLLSSDYAGKAIIHFADHAANRQSTKFNKMESKRLIDTSHIKEFLPTEWNTPVNYKLDLEAKDEKTKEWNTAGTIDVTVEFVNSQGSKQNTMPQDRPYGAGMG